MNECSRDSSSYKVDFVWKGINCAHSSDSSISFHSPLSRSRDSNFAFCNIIFWYLVGSSWMDSGFNSSLTQFFEISPSYEDMIVEIKK